YETTIWIGIMAPAATPKPVIERLNAAVTKITSRPDVKKTWNEQGAEPMTMTIPQFETHLNNDIAKWAKVVKLSGARPDQ
ncbi:MAG: tripartite tricarboxylate transporter substrate binding protein, partial [Betaproteobacteria bacterium]|nr:tripartite tricarboxylate transporter substrate binding protein [Betaproteobacteria bacterium]